MGNEFLIEPFALTDLELDNCHAPAIALWDGIRCFACWQKSGEEEDQIWGGWVEEGIVSAQHISESSGLAYRPAVVAAGDEVWVFWTEVENGCWKVKARCCREGEWGTCVLIREAEGAFHVSAAYCDGEIWAAWSEQSGKKRFVMAARLDHGAASGVSAVSPDDQAYRPAVCADQTGQWFIAYDFYNGSNYDIAVCTLEHQHWEKKEVISTEKNWASSVSMIPGRKGASLCWQDYGEAAHIGYWQADITVDANGRIEFHTRKVTEYVSWAVYSAMAGTPGGSQVMVYSWNGKQLHLRCRRRDADWSEPVELFLGDTSYHIRPRLEIGKDEKIHLIFQHSNGNGQHERKSGISYMEFFKEDLYGYEDRECELGVNAFLKPIEASKTLDRLPREAVREWLEEHGHGYNRLCFGDIHGHSCCSDGLGEPDQYYHRAMEAGLEFTALTDHDAFPDTLTPSEWEYLQAEANRFDGNEMKTLVAYEWTSNELRYNFGHKNVYYRSSKGGFYSSSSPGALTPDRLFRVLKENHSKEVLVIPHHTAAVWRTASAATDWDFHDDKLQRLAEVFSRHASFEYYGNTSIYSKNNNQVPHKSIQDALDRGYCLGLIGGSDSHQMEHGVEGGIMAAFMKDFSREGLFDAMYDRRVYATTGAGILLDFSLNGSSMGQRAAVQGKEVKFGIHVFGTNGLSRVEVIKNREAVVCIEPEGNRLDIEKTECLQEPCGWYYLRVIQEDRHMAWSSPIWVHEEEPEV